MPTLVRAVGMDVKRAAGTNLVVGFLLGIAGFAAHAGEGGVDWPILLAGLAGAIPGGWLGARATGRIDENVLAARARRGARGRRRRFAVAGRGLAADDEREPDRAADRLRAGAGDPRQPVGARTGPASVGGV